MEVADYRNMDKEELIQLLESVNYGKQSGENRIRFPQDVIPHVKKYSKKEEEHFVSLILNGNHEVIKTVLVSKGTVNRSIVHPREVFREAIKKNAVSVIVAHNHPSGNTEPSYEDKEVTTRLADAGNIVGIQVLDHIVFSKTGYYSFLEKGLI